VKEIYADFNDITADGTLPLTCAGSVASIAATAGGLADGESVWLTDGELRIQGRVYRRADGSWEGRSDWRFARQSEDAREDPDRG
jgi:hypothetical protein